MVQLSSIEKQFSVGLKVRTRTRFVNTHLARSTHHIYSMLALNSTGLRISILWAFYFIICEGELITDEENKFKDIFAPLLDSILLEREEVFLYFLDLEVYCSLRKLVVSWELELCLNSACSWMGTLGQVSKMLKPAFYL